MAGRAHVGRHGSVRAMQLTVDDPQSLPSYPDGPISRWCKRSLHDPRDEVFVRLTLRAIGTQLLAMSILFAMLRVTRIPAVLPSLVYLAWWGWSVPPIVLMLHCTMHRKFIRQPKLLDQLHPFVMSFFFGVPTAFREHHIGMHHVEDNLPDDLSSTLRYRRDSFLHFLVYFFRFSFLIAIELPRYLSRERTAAMGRRALAAEIAHVTTIFIVIVFVDWRFGAVAFFAPYFILRFMMMMGNWGQHAFINTARKNDGLSNAITCINTRYNKRCFNDGYHVGHHLRPKCHWTELPGDFIANQARYAELDVIVFQGIDFFFVSLLLWLGAWSVLARSFVRLGEPRSDEEVIAMLKARVLPVRA
jgi:fatty acid desaturase